jgi:outer membrane protein assembly factor BamD (BamD/ComL family)
MLLLASCSTFGPMMPWGPERIPKKLEADRVPHAIESARKELAAGRTDRALSWMRAAVLAENLPTAEREEVQSLLEECAAKRIEELSKPGADPSDLAELVDLDLPRQLAVTAGIEAARRMIEKNELVDAFEIIQKVDTKYPLHHERQQAGEVLGEIGLRLSKDYSHFLIFYDRQDDAQKVLEYLILNYPRAPRCDEAYATLARIYTDERNWSLAIDRLQKLLLNHPTSPLCISAQAEIPSLRLRSIASPEYDRSAVLKAREELEAWLRSHSGEAIETKVRLDLADCLRRLSDSDLGIAKFYGRVHNPTGAHFHAERAAKEAREAGDGERATRAEEFLQEHPAAPADATGPATGAAP